MDSLTADVRMDAKEARKTGTREWADRTWNVCRGCSHDCLYCYARAEKLRYGQIADADEWATEVVNERRVAKGYRRWGCRRVMFPSAHDITPGTVDAVAAVAAKLLRAENKLLLVTKADGPCVERVARATRQWQGGVLWRLTIGCLDERCRRFWEPGAPPIDMRLETLRRLVAGGWETSVSAEPLLQPTAARRLVEAVAPYVTETIWIGAARRLRERTAWVYESTLDSGYQWALMLAVRNLEAMQTPERIRGVYDEMAGLPAVTRAKLRFKDSYAEALRQTGVRVEGGKPVTG